MISLTTKRKLVVEVDEEGLRHVLNDVIATIYCT